VISPSQRPLPDKTHHSQETDTRASGGVRIRNPSKRAAADPRLRPYDHWNRPRLVLQPAVYRLSSVLL